MKYLAIVCICYFLSGCSAGVRSPSTQYFLDGIAAFRDGDPIALATEEDRLAVAIKSGGIEGDRDQAYDDLSRLISLEALLTQGATAEMRLAFAESLCSRNDWATAAFVASDGAEPCKGAKATLLFWRVMVSLSHPIGVLLGTGQAKLVQMGVSEPSPHSVMGLAFYETAKFTPVDTIRRIRPPQ